MGNKTTPVVYIYHYYFSNNPDFHRELGDGLMSSVMTLSQVRRSKDITKRGRFAVPEFCGWPKLHEFYEKCPTDELKGLFATLFETGCRVSESLMLDTDMFSVNDEWVTISNIPVLKKNHKPPKKKIPDYMRLILEPNQLETLEKYMDETQPAKKQRQAPFRTIPIRRTESLIDPMLDYVSSCNGRLFSKTRQWVWFNIVSVDESWWCHRIRSERATQLHNEYNYEVPELMKFFNWSDPKEAISYVRIGSNALKEKVLKSEQ